MSKIIFAVAVLCAAVFAQVPVCDSEEAVVGEPCMLDVGLDNPQKKQKSSDGNFSKGQRWATFGVNSVIPGLGSAIFMKDMLGAGVQWGLAGGFVVSYVGFIANYKCEQIMFNAGGDNYRKQECKLEDDGIHWGIAALTFSTAGLVFNIVRSATYNKPQNTAGREYDGFNVAVLPNEHGEFMALLTYNKAF